MKINKPGTWLDIAVYIMLKQYGLGKKEEIGDGDLGEVIPAQ